MGEQNPAYNEVYNQIDSPVDRAAFRFFFEATVREGVDTSPRYTWDQFSGGVAAFNQLPIELADGIVMAGNLVPNYTAELTKENNLRGMVPLLDALKGPFVQSLHEARQDSAVRVMGIHPSMATPFVIARSLVAAYEQSYGEDIRDSVYIVVGAYPTVMDYEVDIGRGEKLAVSPVDFGRFLGNLVLTAPKTANTETDEEAVQEWMNATRSAFKVHNREILSKPGNILIVHPAGRRGVHSKDAQPPFRHTEYLPDSNLSYITSVDVPNFVVGVDDNLLNSAQSPGSIVHLLGDPRPFRITKDEQVIDALERSALLASHGDTVYRLENRFDQAKRLGKKLIGITQQPNVES